MSEDLAEIRRELGNLRQDFGGVKAEVRSLNTSITRLEGTVEANQKTNQAAHKAQDDRVSELATKWAAHAATEAIKRNMGRVALTVVASAVGGVVSYLATLIHR